MSIIFCLKYKTKFDSFELPSHVSVLRLPRLGGRKDRFQFRFRYVFGFSCFAFKGITNSSVHSPKKLIEASMEA